VTGIKQMPAELAKPKVKLLVYGQTVFIVLLAIMLWQWQSTVSKAWLYGSFIFLIPNAFFVWRSFKYIGAAKANAVKMAMYQGQVWKFILTIFMFAMLFKEVKPELPGLIFISYAVNTLIHICAATVVLNKTHQFK
jgi:ATP synthase protein I